MVDSKAKGARGETVIRDLLRKLTNLAWERVPLSGALDPKLMMKGDLFIPGVYNNYCVEVKNYADDHINSKLLTSTNPQISIWWAQTIRESMQVGKLPLLIFKFDRSKVFVAFESQTAIETSARYVYHSYDKIYIMLLEDFIKEIKPVWV